MVCEMLFEHEAPFLDCCEESLLEWSGVYTEPGINHLCTLRQKENITK